MAVVAVVEAAMGEMRPEQMEVVGAMEVGAAEAVAEIGLVVGVVVMGEMTSMVEVAVVPAAMSEMSSKQVEVVGAMAAAVVDIRGMVMVAVVATGGKILVAASLAAPRIHGRGGNQTLAGAHAR